MNVLFLTMSNEIDLNSRAIYADLMRKFRDEGHCVFIVAPSQRREGKPTDLIEKYGVTYLMVKTLNVQKTNVIEKGLGQVSIEYLFRRAIKKYLSNVKFDLILYSTPPITLTNVVKYVKKVNPQAISYLLLKDIFPQNAVDMGMLSKSGLKGVLYNFFRNKETQLYKASDFIGCMSPANVEYLIKHNKWINPAIVEVAPNSLELQQEEVEKDTKILKKYGLPTDKPILIYGGNLGVPQGIPFLIECLQKNKKREDCHFLIVGSGTYYQQLNNWFSENQNCCVTVMKGLPKEEYDQLVKACHVGLIFLDYRFTIPNFPSRLLSYLEYKMPVICATDPNCDMGNIAIENGFGIWCPSNDVAAFTESVNKILASDLHSMGEKGYRFLKENYQIENVYDKIIKHL